MKEKCTNCIIGLTFNYLGYYLITESEAKSAYISDYKYLLQNGKFHYCPVCGNEINWGKVQGNREQWLKDNNIKSWS